MLHKGWRLSSLVRQGCIVQKACLATEAQLVSSAGEFWSNTQIRDLPDSRPELEIARRHNTSLPYRPEQIVQGSIVHVDKDHVTVDTGHPVRTSFAKRELHLRQLVRSRDTGVRHDERDFRIGDVLHFMLEELVTPFGDIGLRVFRPSDRDRLKMIWEELAESIATQSPVKGRFLNSIYGGYAIGVAGIVGLLPDQHCNKRSFRKIGSLQDFYVKQLDFNTRTLILSDQDSWDRDRRRGQIGNRRPEPGPQMQLKWASRTRDTLVKAQILALMATVRAAGAGRAPDASNPAALEEALQVCESGREVQKEQAFEIIQQLKREVRPEAFRAVWNKLRAWDFDFKGLVLDGVPVVDSRRMVELRTTKPSQTLGWERAAGKPADDVDSRRRQPGRTEEARSAAPSQTAASPRQRPEGSKTQPEKIETRKAANSDGAPKNPEGPK